MQSSQIYLKIFSFLLAETNYMMAGITNGEGKIFANAEVGSFLFTGISKGVFFGFEKQEPNDYWAAAMIFVASEWMRAICFFRVYIYFQMLKTVVYNMLCCFIVVFFWVRIWEVIKDKVIAAGTVFCVIQPIF